MAPQAGQRPKGSSRTRVRHSGWGLPPWVPDGRPARSALLRAGVLLALRFLALPLHARLLVVLATASLRENAALLDLLVEAAKGAFERLVLTHANFGQSGITSSGSTSCTRDRGLVAQRPDRVGAQALPRGLEGRRSVAAPPGRVNRASPGPGAAHAGAAPAEAPADGGRRAPLAEAAALEASGDPQVRGASRPRARTGVHRRPSGTPTPERPRREPRDDTRDPPGRSPAHGLPRPGGPAGRPRHQLSTRYWT